MRFAIVKNAKELAERAFLEIKKVLDEKPDAVIGFATGSTPIPLYDKMADDHKRNGTSYKDVRAFNLDEYVGVDPGDKASFARFMQDRLFSRIDIDPANTDIPNGMAEDLSAECERYSAAVKEHPADIQILGIGANGHIAFNEPYTKPEEPTHIALLTARTRADNAAAFKDPSLVPQYALTMGIDEILTAKRILLLAMGENKAQAIYDMVMGRDDTSCPAAALRRHPDVTVVLDRDAAGLLTFGEWERAAEEREARQAAEEELEANESDEAVDGETAEAAADEASEADEDAAEESAEDEDAADEDAAEEDVDSDGAESEDGEEADTSEAEDDEAENGEDAADEEADEQADEQDDDADASVEK